ncbi:hypothetical protein N9W35_05520 [Flavobacteriaceae bacterium]|nr:hypothetical protein [Flavobacteriaceae bacterium]
MFISEPKFSGALSVLSRFILKMSLLKLNLGEVQILEKTALGFHRVSIKRDRSYRKAMKELPNYVEQGYLDAWIVPYLVIK